MEKLIRYAGTVENPRADEKFAVPPMKREKPMDMENDRNCVEESLPGDRQSMFGVGVGHDSMLD
ncbi:hypothetical protein HHI36_010358, partial [Cryptolaemus montrouzieri]